MTPEALTRKVNQAIRVPGQDANCQAYVHSYRPANELARVLEAVLASDAPQVAPIVGRS